MHLGTNRDLATAMRRHLDTASDVLAVLLARGLVRRERPTPYTHALVVTPKVLAGSTGSQERSAR